MSKDYAVVCEDIDPPEIIWMYEKEAAEKVALNAARRRPNLTYKVVHIVSMFCIPEGFKE